MLAKNTRPEDLDKALEAVNKIYDGNVIFKATRRDGMRRVRFTLTVKDSRGIGAKFSLSYTGKVRRIKAACFHVHGHFFQELFRINPEAVVISRGEKITPMAGNWIDFPVSMVMASESCECMKGKKRI